MLRVLLLSLVITLISCRQKNQNPQARIELIKRYNYRIIIDEWNGFPGYHSTFILNNQCINYHDCGEHYPRGLKPLILYKVSYKQIPDPRNSSRRISAPTDTTETPLTKQQSDTLFVLTKSFLKSIDFNNYDTSRNGIITKPYVTDASQVKVELSYGGRSLSAFISSINNPTIGTKQLDELMKLVYAFKSDK